MSEQRASGVLGGTVGEQSTYNGQAAVSSRTAPESSIFRPEASDRLPTAPVPAGSLTSDTKSGYVATLAVGVAV
ncbi:MAG TPA: hypothetical protein VHC69_34350 [Polyangiaceae bacterium]|nr:hypothetical protein [Polyangiaceae bacterium]